MSDEMNPMSPPPDGDDIEFGFPRDVDDDGARPENRAAYDWWRSAGGPFAVHVTLHGMGIAAGPWYDNLPTTTYFSFVTLTTLGYGDISPVRPMAEVLVILEAIFGMFYLAVIVASLVGAKRIKK